MMLQPTAEYQTKKMCDLINYDNRRLTNDHTAMAMERYYYDAMLKNTMVMEQCF